MSELTREDLMKAAADLNTLYDEPEIKVNTKSTVAQLKGDIVKISTQLEDGDELFQSTIDVLTELECDVPAKIKIKKEAKEQKPKAAPKEKKETKSKEPKELSNKGTIYLKWKAGESDIVKLRNHVKENVKEGTIKAWIQAWKNGKNLPANAK